jgi:hypothetical protein
VEEVNSETTLEYFMENKEKFILPVDEVPTDKVILSLLNHAYKTITVWNGDVDGLPLPMGQFKLMQNNPFHKEGPKVNHDALTGYRARFFEVQCTSEEFEILERACFWSDVGKANTAAPHESKTWDNGTPWTACNGHAEESVRLLDEAIAILKPHAQPSWYKAVRYIVGEHMKMHETIKIQSKGLNDKGRFSKNLGDFTVIPEEFSTRVKEELGKDLASLESWDWPEHDEFSGKLTSQTRMNAGTYNKMRMWRCKLLRMKQQCDEDGRISDLSF